MIRQKIDIPCRYGGKQFVVLLPNTNVDGAYILAERIRQTCEQHTFITQNSISFKVTLSIGVAHNISIDHNKSSDSQKVNEVTKISAEEVIYRAELMLHAAKRTGHNQVMVWW